jgi:hypothetical protein
MNKEKVARDVYNVVHDFEQERPTETNVMIRTAPKRISLPPSLIVFQAAAYLCATKLNASTNRILMFFFAKSAYENYIGIDIKTLMEELNMSKPTVVNGLKDLESNNILIKFQNVNDNRRHDYFINPITAWKGNSFTRDKKIKQITKENPKQLNLFGEDKSVPKKISESEQRKTLEKNKGSW